MGKRVAIALTVVLLASSPPVHAASGDANAVAHTNVLSCSAVPEGDLASRLTRPNEYGLVTLVGTDKVRRTVVILSDVAKQTLTALGVSFGSESAFRGYPGVLTQEEAKRVSDTEVQVSRSLGKVAIAPGNEAIACLWAGYADDTKSVSFAGDSKALGEFLHDRFDEVRVASRKPTNTFLSKKLEARERSPIECSEIAALLRCGLIVGRARDFSVLTVVFPSESKR